MFCTQKFFRIDVVWVSSSKSRPLKTQNNCESQMRISIRRLKIITLAETNRHFKLQTNSMNEKKHTNKNVAGGEICSAELLQSQDGWINLNSCDGLSNILTAVIVWNSQIIQRKRFGAATRIRSNGNTTILFVLFSDHLSADFQDPRQENIGWRKGFLKCIKIFSFHIETASKS